MPGKESYHNILTGTSIDKATDEFLDACQGMFVIPKQSGVRLNNVPFEGGKEDELIKYGSNGESIKDELTSKSVKVPDYGSPISALPAWSTSQFLDSRECNGEQEYVDQFFDLIKLCAEDDHETQPILQSYGELDPHMSKIWWKIYDCGDVQVFNHVEGGVEKEKVAKHLGNGDLFIFKSGTYGVPNDCATVIVPPKVMNRLIAAQKELEEKDTEDADNDKNTEKQPIKDFNTLRYFFGKYDFPESLRSLFGDNAVLEANTNPALLQDF